MARINRDGGAVGSDFRIKRDRTNAPGRARPVNFAVMRRGTPFGSR